MSVFPWPHAHLAHAFRDFLLSGTEAVGEVYTNLPRKRVYPFLVVQTAGVGPLGTQTIQADQPRLQIDAWAEDKMKAEQIAGQVFRLLDKRFGGVQDTAFMTEDTETGDFFQTKVEKVERTGGGDAYFDEIAQKWRVTSFYTVKVNL